MGPRQTIQIKNPRTKKMHQNAVERGNHSRAAKGNHGLAMGTTTGRGDCHDLTVVAATAVVAVVYPSCSVFLRALLFSCAVFRFFAVN